MSADRISLHELRDEFEVWRTTSVDDGQGGYTEATALVGEVQAKVNQPTAQEEIVASQSGAELMYRLHLLPDADVRRGDELRRSGDVYRVATTFRPSEPVYLLATCERRQAENEQE